MLRVKLNLLFSALLVGVLAIGMAACSDDDVGPTPDAGIDAGTDAGPEPVVQACLEACTDDADCLVGTDDLGHKCGADGRCALPAAAPECATDLECCDLECAAAVSGWATVCVDTAACGADEVCIKVGTGTDRVCADAQTGDPLACADGTVAIEAVDHADAAVNVCGMLDQECSAGVCLCTADSACETNEKCLADGTCGCASDLACSADEGTPTCSIAGATEGACICETAADCLASTSFAWYTTCTDGACGCGDNLDCTAAASGWDTACTVATVETDCATGEICIDVGERKLCAVAKGEADCAEATHVGIEIVAAEGEEPAVVVCGVPGHYCDAGACKVKACLSDDDCDALNGLPTCDLEANICVCTADADCADVTNVDVCIDGACGCSSDEACDGDTYFVATTWVCE